MQIELESIIRNNIPLPTTPSGQGFYSILCLVCQDSGRKGPRAGFKFSGSVVGYHCFNCGIRTKYDNSTMSSIPKTMITVLHAFGVPDTDIAKMQFNVFTNGITKKQIQKNTQDTTISITPKKIPLPDEFHTLNDTDDIWATIAKEYLQIERKINWKDYPFMICKKSKDITMRKWMKRLIIPIYNKQQDLVFYQARDLTGVATRKYLNPPTNSSKILYGYNKIFDYQNTLPLYIVEGWFDAFLLDGIAILGNVISDEQALWINKSNRNVVYIPDRFGNGKVTGHQALDLGWKISTPDVGSDPNCKDITDVVVKYGKLYTMNSLAQRITSGLAAQLQLELYCKQ